MQEALLYVVKGVKHKYTKTYWDCKGLIIVVEWHRSATFKRIKKINEVEFASEGKWPVNREAEQNVYTWCLQKRTRFQCFSLCGVCWVLSVWYSPISAICVTHISHLVESENLMNSDDWTWLAKQWQKQIARTIFWSKFLKQPSCQYSAQWTCIQIPFIASTNKATYSNINSSTTLC